MKKKHVIPEIEVVKMETEGVMMAGSLTPPKSDDPVDEMEDGDESMFYSKEHNFNLWED